MDEERIRKTFEAYFEKYKKTEGDRSSWSAPFTSYGPKGAFTVNLTKCPRGDVFKTFAADKKLPEIIGWDQFLEALPQLEKDHPELFKTEGFFDEMKETL